MSALDPRLQNVLQACRSVEPSGLGEICFRWVSSKHRELFGTDMKPSDLRSLEKLGFLRLGDSARGGDRRYYTFADAPAVQARA